MKRKQINKLFAATLSLSLLVGGLLTGCGSGAASTSSTSSSTASEEEAVDSSAETGGEESGSSTASEGHDVVNIGISADVSDWNPFISTGTSGGTLAEWQIYQSLGELIDGEFHGVLMKDYSYSEDGLTLYGELYDNIYDSNGNHMTAEDVAWSYDMANEGGNINLKDFCNGCTATGEYTFEFDLKEPMKVGKFDKFTKWFVVTKASYEASEDEMHTTPVGTGPYKLTAHTSGYSFTYERVDNYWQTDESAKTIRDFANVQTINWYVISEATQRSIALQNGTIDMTNEIAAEDMPTFEASSDFYLSSVPDDLSMAIMPNCGDSSPLHDVNLRLAIFYAIDANALLQSVFGGEGTINCSMAPSWSAGYLSEWDNLENYYTTYDLDLAKEYLEASDYNGEEIIILCSTAETNTSSAQLIQSFMTQLGITNTKIEALDDNILRDYAQDPEKWDMVVNGVACNTYWLDAVNGELGKEKTTWDGSQNFIFDDELFEMLDNYMLEANATDENRNTLHEYITDKAYFYTMVNFTSYHVLPSWCTKEVLSSKKTIIPGACEYSE